MTRKRPYVCAAADSRNLRSSSVRPIVATTRSRVAFSVGIGYATAPSLPVIASSTQLTVVSSPSRPRYFLIVPPRSGPTGQDGGKPRAVAGGERRRGPLIVPLRCATPAD